MSKNCFIYETLNGVKDLNVKRDGEFMTLSGVFGVCGVRNNNKRIYETSNYSKMVTEMQGRIKEEGGIPGELEHPSQMNITLENISHKITDINIDENGVVTGSITLLNTPKGKIAQAIVEGGLPLFISSRATGNVDKSGNVCLERISTYDLVGTPGFSQAKLKLNENQVAESINESVYYVYENDNENNEELDMTQEELLERLERLENRIEELETLNEELQEQLNEVNENKFDEKRFAEGIQNWIIEEFAPEVQNWITEEYSNEVENMIEGAREEVNTDEIYENVQNWVIEEFAPEVQNWITEEYSGEIEKWATTEFATGIQNWIIEEFAPETEAWLNESFMGSVEEKINESVEESKSNKVDAIDATLKVLESLEVQKPTYGRKTTLVNENLDEPKYIREMPADARVKWDMASNEVKESIQRRAKIYNFLNEGAIEKFWSNIDFEEIKPATNIYEGLETIENEVERNIRMKLRSWRAGRQ